MNIVINRLANIVSRLPLANGFEQITLASSHLHGALPGHYVVANNTLFCSIMSVDVDHADCIVTPNMAPDFLPSTVSLSALQGAVISPPDPNPFYLWITPLSRLGSIIFYLKKYRSSFQGLILIETDSTFPFHPVPSRILIPHLPSDTIACMPLLETWGIPSRLAALQEIPGCFHGTAEALANIWLANTFLPSLSIIRPPCLYSSF